MKILHVLFRLLFPPKSEAEIVENSRMRWAVNRATGRPMSYAQVRSVLTAVDNDYGKADMLLGLWETTRETSGEGKAWQMVWECAAKK